MEPPFEQWYWVFPGELLAGCYPTARSDRSRLLDAGVRLIINLTEKNESGLEEYEKDIDILAQERGHQVTCVRTPIPDFGSPNEAEMKAILDEIDKAIEAGKTVYVHCHGGKGRTGTVVGCYLVRRDAAGGDALRKIRELREGAGAGGPSPETEEQRNLVRSWKPGQ